MADPSIVAQLPVPTPGRKDDFDKLRWSLLPVSSVRAVVRAVQHGANKYDDDNWQRVPDACRRYYDAALRHITAWWDGERRDPESGLPHLSHAAASLLFLLWHDDHPAGD